MAVNRNWSQQFNCSTYQEQVRDRGVPQSYPDEWLELRWIRPGQTSLTPLQCRRGEKRKRKGFTSIRMLHTHTHTCLRAHLPPPFHIFHVGCWPAIRRKPLIKFEWRSVVSQWMRCEPPNRAVPPLNLTILWIQPFGTVPLSPASISTKLFLPRENEKWHRKLDMPLCPLWQVRIAYYISWQSTQKTQAWDFRLWRPYRTVMLTFCCFLDLASVSKCEEYQVIPSPNHSKP